MDTAENDARDTLLSLPEAAAALGLRRATITQDIQTGQLTAVRVPCGHAIRLFIAPAEIARYRAASLGGQSWIKRRMSASLSTTDQSGLIESPGRPVARSAATSGGAQKEQVVHTARRERAGEQSAL